MAGLLIRGCGILTMNPEGESFPAGDILIEGDRLISVGPLAHPDTAGIEVIDGRGKIAMPGFVNAHHHLFQSLLRGLAPNSRLPNWLTGCLLLVGPHLTPDDLHWAVRLSLAECIESGVTSTIDWAFNLHSVEHAAATLEGAIASGARVHFAYGPSLAGGWGDFDIRRADFERIRERYFDGHSAAGRMRLWLGLGGPELQPEKSFRDEFALARKYGLHVHIHLREVETLQPADGVERMREWGLLGPDLLLAHAVHLRDPDIGLLAESGTKVSYNPLSNMRLGSGICRVVELRRAGVDVALGLDGSASNDNNDYFALMRSAIGLQRARNLSADCLPVDDLLRMATVDGARALGDREVGMLAPGMKADVILIDPGTLNFTPLNDFVGQLVFCGQPRNVDTVIVDGRVLKRGGELVGVDRDEIMSKCTVAARRLLSAGQVSHRPLRAE
jgi:5-methylthioadenosine/S-adenosylhomocysteine deaminase